MSDQRLHPLVLLPPPVETPWAGEPLARAAKSIRRQDDVEIPIELPLFWYDPPWCNVGVDMADYIATSVASTGIMVSAMRSDISGRTNDLALHQVIGDDDDIFVLPRIVPYRPERYGLDVRDFDWATIVDVKLNITRDESGRFAFSPTRIARWEATPDGQPLAGGSWVPAATFPPDVVSLEHLAKKLDQLRVLAPSAAIFVSVEPYRMDAEMKRVLPAKPDGIILRMDDVDLDGLQLAALTHRARQMMDEGGARDTPLWVVPGDITADDAVKLSVLGASGIAVDAWCDPLIDEAMLRSQPTVHGGYISLPEQQQFLAQMIQYQIGSRIERFRGLSQSLLRVPVKKRMGTFSNLWSKTLKVKALH